VDLSGWLIAVFHKLRWATEVKSVSAKQMASKQIARFKPRSSLIAASKAKAHDLADELKMRQANTSRN
jgi:hypothetical protein